MRYEITFVQGGQQFLVAHSVDEIGNKGNEVSEKIKELAITVGIVKPEWEQVPPSYQKFAELIVRECIREIDKFGTRPYREDVIAYLKEHFELELCHNESVNKPSEALRKNHELTKERLAYYNSVMKDKDDERKD